MLKWGFSRAEENNSRNGQLFHILELSIEFPSPELIT